MQVKCNGSFTGEREDIPWKIIEGTEKNKIFNMDLEIGQGNVVIKNRF